MTGERPVIYGDGEQTRDFTYIANITDANIKAAQMNGDFGGIANVANGERVSLNELFAVMKRVTGRNDIIPVYEAARKGDVQHSQADNSRAREWFGYENLVDLEPGIKKTIDWWKTSRFAR